MMNARVLELIKNPELIQNEDLKLLDSEIKNYPYVQNIRALRLFGIHKFNPENYQTELSTTAAFTTDKKTFITLSIKNQFKSLKSNNPRQTVLWLMKSLKLKRKKNQIRFT